MKVLAARISGFGLGRFRRFSRFDAAQLPAGGVPVRTVQVRTAPLVVVLVVAGRSPAALVGLVAFALGLSQRAPGRPGPL